MARILLPTGLLLAVASIALTEGAGADAHSALIRSSPISDTVLAASPGEIIFWFSEPVVVESSQVRLLDLEGNPHNLGDFHHHGNAANPGLGVEPDLPNGSYSVEWAVVSATDGHSSSGSFSFEVNATQLVGTPIVSVRPVEEGDGDSGGSSTKPVLIIVVVVAGAAAFGAWRARGRG